MDVNQFAQFYGAIATREANEQADRTAERQDRAQERADRAQERTVDRQERLAERARKERIRRLESQTKAVKSCDGSSTVLVREWFQDMSIARTKMAGPQLEELTVRLISATLQGSMRRFFERWVISYAARPGPLAPMTWDMIREALQGAYLTLDEGEFLKSELETLRQTSYETSGAYSRRFVEAADMAYPAPTRNATIASQLKEKYLRGLKSESLVRQAIREGKPTTLEEACEAVEACTAEEEQIKRLRAGQRQASQPERRGRYEEPMEVNLIAPVPRYHEFEEEDPQERAIDNLQQQLDEIALVARGQVAPVSRPPPTSDLEHIMAALAKMNDRMGGMSKELTKLKGQTLYVAPPGAAANVTTAPATTTPTNYVTFPGKNRNGSSNWTNNGVPFCFECKELGHMGKECPVRIQRLAAKNQGNGNASQ